MGGSAGGGGEDCRKGGMGRTREARAAAGVPRPGQSAGWMGEETDRACWGIDSLEEAGGISRSSQLLPLKPSWQVQ